MTTLIEIIIWVVSFIVAYFTLRRFIKLPEHWTMLTQGYLILAPFALAFLLFAIYYYNSGKSESFKKGIEILSSDKKILDEIGGYESCSFFKDSLPKETDNPAKFKVQLNGSEAVIYLSVIMLKDKSGNWTIQNLKQDSLVRNK